MIAFVALLATDPYFLSLVVLVVSYSIYRSHFKSKPKCIIHEGIRTKIAVTSNQCIALLTELESYQPTIVGLDIEWSSQSPIETNRCNRVSLLQIGHKDFIILIRLHLLHTIPGKLHDFLGNVEILKAGIGIYDDKRKLRTDYQLDIHGCVDLNHIFTNKLSQTKQNELRSSFHQKEAHELTKQEMNNTLGLNSMSCILLNHPMKYKHKASNYHFHNHWNDTTLTMDQMHYAADDALVAFQLFTELMHITSANESHLTFCYGLIDIIKKDKIKAQRAKQKSNHRLKKKQRVLIAGYTNEISQLASCNVVRKDLLQVTALVMKYYPTRKQYVGRREDGSGASQTYYHCVCCGKKDKLFNLPKFHIVPNQYIKYINIDADDETFVPANNVILTCKPCKRLCDRNADEFRAQLCKTYKIPCVRTRQMFIKVRTAAQGLIDRDVRYKLPMQYQMDLVRDVCAYFNLAYEIVCDVNERKQQNNNNGEDYKWQWYDNTVKCFVDYTDGLSDQIENEYSSDKDGMRFTIENESKGFVNEYKVDFTTMEQQNMKSRYKRGMRRIYRRDSEALTKYDLNRFDHLIKVVESDNKCCIGVTTNDIILCCIDDIIKNGQKSVRSLQREQFEIHSREILNIFKAPSEFAQLWKQNFKDIIKPKHYNDSF